MEEIKFKPSLAIEKFFLFLFLAILIILFLILFIIEPSLAIALLMPATMGFGTIIVLMINKAFTTYTITSNNEIIIDYKFITSYSKVYRVDQMTSVTLNRNLFHKFFGLGEVHFGIFGKNNIYQADSKGNGQQLAISAFKSIKEYDSIFQNMIELLGLSSQVETVYEDKPSLKPDKFWIKFNLSIIILEFMVLFSSWIFLPILDIKIAVSIAICFMLFFSFIIFISYIFAYKKTKSTKYKIGKDRLENSFDYIFGKNHNVVPINKITNSQVNKNLISYWLFKIGSVKIFTGGSSDPYFPKLIKYEEFMSNISNKYSPNELNSQTTIEESTQAQTQSIERGDFTKPSSSFMATFFYWTTILFAPLIIYGLVFYDGIEFAIMGFIVYAITLILRYILWKNTSYEFFQDRVIDRSGILNITTKEIYFKNVKHIELSRGLFFDRILGQGTIHLFTPGTGFVDNKINSVKEYRLIYDKLKDVLSE